MRKLTGRLALIATRGALDALANANTLGAYDFFEGNKHIGDYTTKSEQKAYPQGRITGDASAIVQGISEVNGGGGAALVTGIETAGIGFLMGGSVAAHGAVMGSVATANLITNIALLRKLYQLKHECERSIRCL